jgi:acid phosphatase
MRSLRMTLLRMTQLTALVLASAVLAGAASPPAEPGTTSPPAESVAPHGSHVTIVMLENKSYDLIVGSSQAPYVNDTLIPQGALLKSSHAVTHPSEPNYLALFSGSTQGVTGDQCPLTFSAANSASELIHAGKTFAGYSESMPSDGYRGCWSGGSYARKHNPWVSFTNVPSSGNLVYRQFPSSPPSLAWIVPNLCNDMHDCSVKTGDAWLAQHLPAMIAWNKSHNGLLILTWDEAEPDPDGTNRIPTILVGPMVRAGAVSTQNVDHYSVLRTVETILGIPCIAQECHRAAISGIWK